MKNKEYRNLTIEECEQGIEDWLSILDKNDKEQAMDCLKNIAKLQEYIKKLKKNEAVDKVRKIKKQWLDVDKTIGEIADLIGDGTSYYDHRCLWKTSILTPSQSDKIKKIYELADELNGEFHNEIEAINEKIIKLERKGVNNLS